ncbi:MAG: Crp/Fnr family transcriptional regulator [Oscillospiraceae bacterium]
MEEFNRITLTTPDLYNEELDSIIGAVAEKVTYPAKFVFSTPGSDMCGIYYIERGRTKHYMDSADGVTKILYTLTAGWFFGETPYFLKTATGLFSQTETETVLYKIPDSACQKLMVENRLFRETMLKCYSLKMLMLRYEIANLTFNSCKSRLKRLFCSSVDTEVVTEPGWYNMKVHYTHYELSEIVGGARVTISRQINELCAEGFLRTINRHMQVNIAKYKEYMAQRDSTL